MRAHATGGARVSTPRINPYLTQWVETSGLALPVPRGARREFAPAPRDEACEWTLGPLHVRYRRQWKPDARDGAEGPAVEALVGGHRVAVWFQPSRIAPSVHVADPVQRGVVHVISVGGSSVTALRQWVLAEAVHRLRFINFHHGLRLTAVNAARGSFTWCNEVGRARTGVRGDVVTRDGGRVLQVRPDRVVVADPGFDALGRPCLVERTVWLDAGGPAVAGACPNQMADAIA